MGNREKLAVGVSLAAVAGLVILASRRAEAATPIDVVITDITVSPDPVYVNEPVTISFLATNTSAEKGTANIIIGGDINMAINITLNPGESRDVILTFVPPDARQYQVTIDGLTAHFTATVVPVVNIVATNLVVSPTSVQIGQTVTITVTVKNTGNVVGSRLIDVAIT